MSRAGRRDLRVKRAESGVRLVAHLYFNLFPCQILENKKFIEVGHSVTFVNNNNDVLN